MQRRTLLLAALPAFPALLTACVSVPSQPLPTPRIGIALGGGAAKGFAHVGVIKVLKKPRG